MSVLVARSARAELYVTVDQAGGGDVTTVTDALALVPPAPLEPTLIEILDSGDYYETVTVSKTTTDLTGITIQAATGASPTIHGQNTYSGAIHITSPYTTIRGLRVVACSCSGGSGIAIAASNVTVEQCTVSGARSPNPGSDPIGGINVGGADAVIRHNVVCDSDSGVRIYDYGGDRAEVRNNLIFGNLYQGIWLYRAVQDNLVFNNTLADNRYEILLGHGGGNYDPGSGNEFFSNVLYADNGGYAFVVDQEGDPMTLPASTVVDYNVCFAEPGYGFPARLDGTTYFTFADWQAASGAEDHGVWGDPLFTDAPNGDFTPGAGSPVVDAGNPLPQYDDVDGTTSDVGAWGGPDPFPFVGPVACGATQPGDDDDDDTVGDDDDDDTVGDDDDDDSAGDDDDSAGDDDDSAGDDDDDTVGDDDDDTVGDDDDDTAGDDDDTGDPGDDDSSVEYDSDQGCECSAARVRPHAAVGLLAVLGATLLVRRRAP